MSCRWPVFLFLSIWMQGATCAVHIPANLHGNSHLAASGDVRVHVCTEYSISALEFSTWQQQQQQHQRQQCATRLWACEEVNQGRVFFFYISENVCVLIWKEENRAIVVQTHMITRIIFVCRDQSDADRISNRAGDSLIHLGFISCHQLWWNKYHWDETRV